MVVTTLLTGGCERGTYEETTAQLDNELVPVNIALLTLTYHMFCLLLLLIPLRLQTNNY